MVCIKKLPAVKGIFLYHDWLLKTGFTIFIHMSIVYSGAADANGIIVKSNIAHKVKIADTCNDEVASAGFSKSNLSTCSKGEGSIKSSALLIPKETKEAPLPREQKKICEEGEQKSNSSSISMETDDILDSQVLTISSLLSNLCSVTIKPLETMTEECICTVVIRSQLHKA